MMPTTMLLEFADQAGRAYAATTVKAHQKSLGQYLTPVEIARAMASRAVAGMNAERVVRVIDPAAGAGILAVAACEALVAHSTPPEVIELVCYEIDPDLAAVLREVMGEVARRLAPRVRVDVRVIESDFILDNAGRLTNELFDRRSELFDLVISNPPYFKLNKEDARARACASLVHGQPNIYGLFMGVCAAMLRPGARFCFITPRSWASGPYFEHLRKQLLLVIRPCEIHLFDSRTASFSRDEVLQEVMIAWGERADGWLANAHTSTIRMSTSKGAADIEQGVERRLPATELLDIRDRHLVLKLPATQDDDRVVGLVHSWSGSLARYGLKISTGPVVHFRTLDHLRQGPQGSVAPLLWLSHVKAMQVSWPLGLTRKAEYIEESSESAYVLVPNKNYVLLRRFSAKEEARRLVAAPYFALEGYASVGLENHLNFIYRPNGEMSVDETWGFAALLNSALLDQYFRCVNGNTQVSATELRAMPMPPLEAVKEIGRRIRGITDLERIDPVVARIVGADAPEAAVA